MAKSKDQLVAEDTLWRELGISEPWKQVFFPWLNERYEALRDEISKGLPEELYLKECGKIQQIKEIVAEVERRGRRKSTDILD